MPNSTTLQPAPQAPLATLPDLAVQINDEHHQAEAALNTGLEHARHAGELLLQAKSLCQHGEWLPWLEANFDGSARTARAYILVADRWPQIEAKWQHAANLSIRGALQLLAPPVVEPTAVQPLPWAIDGENIQIGQFSLTPTGIIDTEPTRKPSLDEFRQVVAFIKPFAQIAEQARGK